MLKSIAGGFNSRTLPIIFAAMQSKRTSISCNVHTDRDARNTRMHCAGRNKCIHNNSFNGHENHAHGQKVSIFLLLDESKQAQAQAYAKNEH